MSSIRIRIARRLPRTESVTNAESSTSQSTARGLSDSSTGKRFLLSRKCNGNHCLMPVGRQTSILFRQATLLSVPAPARRAISITSGGKVRSFRPVFSSSPRAAMLESLSARSRLSWGPLGGPTPTLSPLTASCASRPLNRSRTTSSNLHG